MRIVVFEVYNVFSMENENEASTGTLIKALFYAAILFLGITAITAFFYFYNPMTGLQNKTSVTSEEEKYKILNDLAKNSAGETSPESKLNTLNALEKQKVLVVFPDSDKMELLESLK